MVFSYFGKDVFIVLTIFFILRLLGLPLLQFKHFIPQLLVLNLLLLLPHLLFLRILHFLVQDRILVDLLMLLFIVLLFYLNWLDEGLFIGLFVWLEDQLFVTLFLLLVPFWWLFLYLFEKVFYHIVIGRLLLLRFRYWCFGLRYRLCCRFLYRWNFIKDPRISDIQSRRSTSIVLSPRSICRLTWYWF